jgi:hypothetical protein
MNSIDGLKRFQATSISRDHGNFQMAFSIYGCGFLGLENRLEKFLSAVKIERW